MWISIVNDVIKTIIYTKIHNIIVLFYVLFTPGFIYDSMATVYTIAL